MAPGYEGEDMAPFAKRCAGLGMAQPPVFASAREMLDTVKPDILAVFEPYEAHAAMSIEALM